MDNIIRYLIINTSVNLPDHEEDQTNKIIKLFDISYRFIKHICKDRDESHSVDHLLNVTYKSLIIFNQMISNGQIIPLETMEDVITCAILHDVADYKYDTEEKLAKQVKAFINQLCECHKISKTSSEDLWWIIDNLSFSKEKKAGSLKNLIKNTYNNSSFSSKLILIRNIVSDADRLEAIGKNGITRCIMYGKHANPGVDKASLKLLVKKHADEKLLMMPFGDPITKEPYFHTGPGRQMALVEHKNTEKHLHQYLIS